MQRVPAPDYPLLIDRLERELRSKRKAVEAAIRDIKRLERELANAKRVGAEGAPLQRSSSALRLIVEQAIVKRLKQSAPPETSASQLWPIVQALGVRSHSTFRSHLRRMAAQGIIRSTGRGRWRLVATYKPSPSAIRSVYRSLGAERDAD